MEQQSKDFYERDLALRKFYAEQRDKHLQQLMAINGQATFAILGIAAALVAAILSNKIPSVGNKGVTPLMFIIGAILVIIFFVLFLSAAAIFSSFHTRKMERFESLITNPVEFDQLEANEFQIAPRGKSNYLVFFGVLTLIAIIFYFMIIKVLEKG